MKDERYLLYKKKMKSFMEKPKILKLLNAPKNLLEDKGKEEKIRKISIRVFV